MNPHPDSFENALSALQRRPLAAAWRDEMLKTAAQKSRVVRTPRWLLVGWSLAWAATLVLYFTTPAEPAATPAANMSQAATPMLWQQRAAAIEALLAAN